MVTIVSDRAVWVKSFKAIVCNMFKELRMQWSPLSKRTDCASFELDPHRDYTPELYLECRFEVFSKDPEVEDLEKDAVRIVVLLLDSHTSHATRISTFLREVIPTKWNVRLSKSGRRIYVTETGLPTLDLTQHVSKQVENINRYGGACVQLQELWKANVGKLDSFVAELNR